MKGETRQVPTSTPVDQIFLQIEEHELELKICKDKIREIRDEGERRKESSEAIAMRTRRLIREVQSHQQAIQVQLTAGDTDSLRS